MGHEYTTESICHLTCSKCQNWWSYAYEARKYDIKLPSVMNVMCCPHCGFKDSVVRKEKS